MVDFTLQKARDRFYTAAACWWSVWLLSFERFVLRLTLTSCSLVWQRASRKECFVPDYHILKIRQQSSWRICEGIASLSSRATRLHSEFLSAQKRIRSTSLWRIVSQASIFPSPCVKQASDFRNTKEWWRIPSYSFRQYAYLVVRYTIHRRDLSSHIDANLSGDLRTTRRAKIENANLPD